MSELLKNYLGGRWQCATGETVPLFDPVLGDELVRVGAHGLDLAAGFAFSRQSGGGAASHDLWRASNDARCYRQGAAVPSR